MTLLVKGVKKALENCKGFLFSGECIQAQERLWLILSGHVQEKWMHALYSKWGPKNPSLERGRDDPVVNVEVLIMKCRIDLPLSGREMKIIVKLLFNQRRASTFLSHKYVERISL